MGNDRITDMSKLINLWPRMRPRYELPNVYCCGNRECRGIEPLLFRPLKAGKGVTYHIRAFVDVGVTDIGNVRAVDDGLRFCPLRTGEDTVELPVTQDVVAECGCRWKISCPGRSGYHK